MGLYKPGSCYSWEKLYKLIIVYYNQNFLSEIILINAASETSNAHVFL